MNDIMTINYNSGIVESGFNKNLFLRWINFIDVKPKTTETYTRAIKQFLVYLQDNNINQPTRDTVINYREMLKNEHKPTTVQAYLMAVKQFFKWTAAENLYPNIAERVKSEKINKGFKKDYLTTAQVKKGC